MKKQTRTELSVIVHPETISEGFSQSESQMLDNCAEKWYLYYNERLSRRNQFSWALLYGTWMHSFIEEFNSTRGKRWTAEAPMPRNIILTHEQNAQYEFWSKLLEIQASIYASRYKQDATFYEPVSDGVEKQADIMFDGVRLRGKLDLFAYVPKHKGYFMVDNKTTSRLDKTTLMGWDFRFQFMFYCWLAWKCWPKFPIKGFYTNAIRKPQLKQGVNETTPAFLQRIRSDMLVRDEFYFYREPLLLVDNALQHFEDNILHPKILRFKAIMNPDVPIELKIPLMRNKNTDHCTAYSRACQYLPICQHSLEVEKHQFYRRENKHEELDEVEIE